MTRRTVVVGLLALLVGLQVLPAHALTDEWAGWAPITGTSNNFATELRQVSPGFPVAAVATDSRAPIQLASSAVITGSTTPGAKYGTSSGSRYLILRPKADNATSPSTTTYTFDNPTPDIGWAFVLGDVDTEDVRIQATDETGDPVPAGVVDGWFQGVFNYAGGTDLPTWDGGTSTLAGSPGPDSDGASGWFEPDVRLTSLTFTFTRRTGFPIFQTWFVSRARPIGGTVSDDSVAPASCPVEDATVTLESPFGETLATTSPAADGSYDFGEFATQSGYVVRVTPPPICAVLGPSEQTASNEGNDGDPASRADFAMREIIPQPISGTVRDDDGNPVPGVQVTLTRPGGGSDVITTGPDGTYLFDENPVDTGYTAHDHGAPGLRRRTGRDHHHRHRHRHPADHRPGLRGGPAGVGVRHGHRRWQRSGRGAAGPHTRRRRPGPHLGHGRRRQLPLRRRAPWRLHDQRRSPGRLRGRHITPAHGRDGRRHRPGLPADASRRDQRPGDRR